MTILYIISLSLFLIGLFIFIISLFIKSNYKFSLKRNNKNNYAILIPAKDESKVIENLLKSIVVQNNDMSNTYIIVEDMFDKTCQISEKYGSNIILRKDLTKKRKGFALDEAIKEILKTKEYDLYFILDADNILDNNFISEMLKTYKEGYDIGVGYRNIKNGNNVISAVSGITFSMVNIFNEFKNKNKSVVTISGTGYYISGKVINKLKSFPFNSLTEDYEISLYASANNLSTFYNKNAIFYDEQPTRLNISIKQRTRWVKGFIEARNKRLKDVKNDSSRLLGLIPYLFMVFGLLLFIFSNLFGTIYYIIIGCDKYIKPLLYLFYSILSIYLLFALFTIYVVKIDKNLNLSNSLKLKSILFNPFFLATYLICFISAVTKKEINWEKIEHKDNLKRY